MGDVKIRYYVTRQAWRNSRKWGYWVPTKAMRLAGFTQVCCGEDGPVAWATAQRCNADWDKVKNGGAVDANAAKKIGRVHLSGSLGEAFTRFRATNTWLEKKPRTREDWERGWKHIERFFGDVAPATVALEDVDGWYAFLLEKIGVREAQRAMKIWRALWRVAGTMNAPSGKNYCVRDADPSLGIRCKQPSPRNAFWFEGEAVRLVKASWRMGYKGLAAALAVAWDTMLSPVDVRRLTMAQLKSDGTGSLFEVDRAKTGKRALGTVSRRTLRLVEAYVATLPFKLHPDAPIFHTRGSAPGAGRLQKPVAYTKPMLGEDFRAVRAAAFPGDRRRIMDFRRSGAIEANVGEVAPGALAGKMANSIDQNRVLQETYTPHTAQLVRLADVARISGRGRLRGGNTSGSKS